LISKAPASAVLYRLGFLDRRFVVPGAANGNLVHARQSKVGDGLGLIVATPSESRAAPGRELVDPRGPLIQTRIHGNLSYVVAPMVRPTHSRVVTEFDIVGALDGCNMIKTNSFIA
jgi:hypothetical protein